MSPVQSGVAVRPAMLADAAPLAEFGRRAFLDTYGPDNDPAQTAGHLARTFGEALQRAEIAGPHTHMIVAEVDGALAGYALVRADAMAPVAEGPTAQAELARFYVDTPWQGRGLADALMDAALETSGLLGAEALWLTVWDRNARAIRFYARRGFREVGIATFLYGTDPQQDLVLMRVVRERRGPSAAGAPARVVRPALRVTLQRGREGRDLIACVRADGTTSWLRRPGGLPRHDRALLVIEGTLGLPDGVFARVAGGGELLELLRAESAAQPNALGWSLRFATMLDAEAVAPHAAGLEAVRVALLGGADAATAPMALDHAQLAAVRAADAQLEATWRTVGPGERLEFTLTPGEALGLSAAVVAR